MKSPVSLYKGIIIGGLLLVASCGYYYTADLAGYVKDADSKAGINGARVRIYTALPAAPDADGYLVDTPTMTSGGNNGYFSHKIIWNNWFGSFGDAGDTGEIWISVMHEDYMSIIEQRTGLLSDTLNMVADILMQRASFIMNSLQGRIIDSTGNGVNGVRVVLDLASTADETADYVVVSGTDAGTDGIFTFNNIRWRDDTADTAGSDTENAGLYIDDTNYNSAYTVGSQLALVLNSDDDAELPHALTVTRAPRTIFSANTRGRCFYRLGIAPDYQEFPISGIETTLTYSDDNGLHTLYTQTDMNGYYYFTLEWEEDPPADNGTGITIPEGEDVLTVDIAFTPNATPGNVYAFTGFTDYAVKSWLNPNYLPERVDLDPEA